MLGCGALRLRPIHPTNLGSSQHGNSSGGRKICGGECGESADRSIAVSARCCQIRPSPVIAMLPNLGGSQLTNSARYRIVETEVFGMK